MTDTCAPATKMFSFLQEMLPRLQDTPFAVKFKDGTLWESDPNATARFTLTVSDPSKFCSIFMAPDQLSLGEAFIFGDFDIEGDVIAAFRFADEIYRTSCSIVDKLRYGWYFRSILRRGNGIRDKKGANMRGNRHSRKRDKEAVRFHYDVGNDFYRLWLDQRMVYSCAYFDSPNDDLDAAQLHKLDYICRKLRLQPGDRLLDIGCGWGALLLYAAQKYGVDAFGITLSSPQAESANEMISDAGLTGRCRVEVCDYRDLDDYQSFDKVVSVGMFEHVGAKLLPEYFKRAWKLLRAGGVFLNHGIACSLSYRSVKRRSFIDRYVFPDGELMPISEVLGAAETTGFEVRDLESLREHYALTLRYWVKRLEEAKKVACSLTSEITYRIWRIYMAGSAYGFDNGTLNLYQALLIKPAAGISSMPMTRRDWYELSHHQPW